MMRRSVLTMAVLCLVTGAAMMAGAQTDPQWKWHDRSRPMARVVDPGTASTPTMVGHAPSDAIVLFDGKNLDAWIDKNGAAPKWKIENGELVVVAKSGPIFTKKPLGDMQLHVEFAEPVPAEGKDQDRGNSGVILMGQYEIQVLDSYNSVTYADGQAGAVYGQYPPLVNVSRPPGEWQSYDIIFHGPRFDKDGKVTRKARVTVLQNGVLVQDNVEIEGNTTVPQQEYRPHPEKVSLELQDHNHPVRFRNIWARELAEGQ